MLSLLLEALAALDDEGDGLLDIETRRLGLDHRRHPIDERLLPDRDDFLELGLELVEGALLGNLPGDRRGHDPHLHAFEVGWAADRLVAEEIARPAIDVADELDALLLERLDELGGFRRRQEPPEMRLVAE